MATLKIQLPGQGDQGLPDPQEAHLAGARRGGRRGAPRSVAVGQPGPHPLRRPRVQPGGHRSRRRDLRQRAQADEAASWRTTTGSGSARWSWSSRSTTSPAPRRPPPATDATELASYKKLYEFSGKLMESYELPTLVDQLLDVMIQVSNADKGFLVLMESGEPVVKAARNLRRETISDAVEPALRLDPGPRHQDAAAAHHLGRAPRRGVQELALGGEPQAHLGHVRAAARARQHAGGHLRRQRQRGRAVRRLAPGGAVGLRGAGLAAGAQRAPGQRAQARQPLAAEPHRADPLRRDPRLVRRACRRSSARSRRWPPPTSRC